MEGLVLESFINYLDKFGSELLLIQFGLLVILSTMFLWLWFLNRRKYHSLKHSIPANIVKNYLDSIIENSNALKSSLFRGGGFDTSVPSVIPLAQLMGGESLGLSGAPSTALLEELNQKKALIASLESQLIALQRAQKEMEGKITRSSAVNPDAENRIKELEQLLANSRDTGGGDDSLKQELAMLTRQRDEYQEKLKEFEIISDDLANLKRLQQENDQLKRSLAALQGGAVEQVDNIQPESSPSQAGSDLDDFLKTAEATSSDQDAKDNMNAVEELLTESSLTVEPSPTSEKESLTDQVAKDASKAEKTPEDLLSEFEKMLG